MGRSDLQLRQRKANHEDGLCIEEVFIDEEEEAPLIDASGKDEDVELPVQQPPPGFSFSIRKLAYLTLSLFFLSQAMYESQCLVARAKRKAAERPFLTEWQVKTTSTALDVMKRPDNKVRLDEIQPGEHVEFMGDYDKDYHYVLRPSLGWTKKISKKSGKPYFEKVADDPHVRAWCPLIYAAEASASTKYMNAPVGLVFGQTLWNGVQVLHIFLTISVVYEVFQPNTLDSTLSFRRKIAASLIAMCTVYLLPFAAYMISPGAHLWAWLTLAISLLAILTPVSNLQISIGIKGGGSIGRPKLQPVVSSSRRDRMWPLLSRF